jgi:hypothetical protein
VQPLDFERISVGLLPVVEELGLVLELEFLQFRPLCLSEPVVCGIVDVDAGFALDQARDFLGPLVHGAAKHAAEQIEPVLGECRGDGRECCRNEWYGHTQSPFSEVTVGVANLA